MHSNLDEISTQLLNCDICVVGTGPAGLSIVSKLLKINKKIILLESGNLSDTGDHDFLNIGKSIGPRFLDVQSSRLRTFGGAGKLWAGVCRHFSLNDFERNNWPINYADFIPYYIDAYNLFGLNSNFNFEESSNEKYFLYQNLKELYKNDSFFNAKSFIQASEKNRDLTNKFGNEIINSKNINLITNATAVDIKINPFGNAEKLEVFSINKNKLYISAKKFVLCMGALENCRFLMNSRTRKYINANSFGKGFMSHPGFSNIGKVYLNPKCLSKKNNNKINKKLKYFNTELKQEFINKEKILGHGFSLKPVNIRNKLKNMQFNEIINNLNYVNVFENIKCNLQNEINIPKEWDVSIGIEQEFLKNNYLKQSTAEKDIFNKPILEVFWDNISKKEIKTIQIANRYFARQVILSKLGVFELSEKIKNNSVFLEEDSINHHIGLTKMSKKNGEGVVDENLKLHNIQNVYVSGSCVFPSSASVNPTLTVSALSLRLADHLINIV